MVTIAVVTTTYLSAHHEWSVQVMGGCGYLSDWTSVLRFSCRPHELADWMVWNLKMLGEVCTTGDMFIVESISLPVCHRVRA